MTTDKSQKEYDNATNEERLIWLAKRNEKLMNSIKKNIQFFFWFTIISLIASIIIYIKAY